MKIAIEGMDGVGKTTIAKKIAEDNGLMYIDKPLHYFFEDNAENGYADLMKMANRLYDVDDPVIRSWFFGLGNLVCFRKFQDQGFVVDRHFVSNYFWNGSDESYQVFESMINIISVPDLTILLYATPETRLKRLIKRDPNDKDITDPEKKVDGYDKMLKFVELFKLPYLFINTEDKTIDEIVNEINIELDKLSVSLNNKPFVKRLEK
ncbi:MAG: AAA family ATPase [Bacilli bacterium]|nr:AAA family ATPase [Bacilli bacterium]